MKIAGKTVVITGASSGLGAALAQRMWRAGAARLILLGRHEARLNQVVRALRADSAYADAVLADLSYEDDVHAVVDWLRAHAGPVDILVNNAGAGAWNFLEDSTFAEIREAMAVPYLAAAWLSGAPCCRRCGNGSAAISSISARSPPPWWARRHGVYRRLPRDARALRRTGCRSARQRRTPHAL
ncbi:MAG: SDR family NAD(P)-dependent oxidoreductase [Uliginosibacterium sp.]|nr:SDR family NAD(P)-dependent oxidoreductase [Uliginosibacterium sp.]